MSAASISEKLDVALVAKNSSRVFRQQADVFFDEILHFEGFPDDYFSLLCRVISTPSLYKVTGAEMFLFQTYVAAEELSLDQRDKILSLLIDLYPSYANENMCLVAADFLARVYEPHIALNAFERILEKVVLSQQALGIAVALGAFSGSESLEQDELLDRVRRVRVRIAEIEADLNKEA
jgi:hypothetical protein